MKKYLKPICELEVLELEDIILASKRNFDGMNENADVIDDFGGFWKN